MNIKEKILFLICILPFFTLMIFIAFQPLEINTLNCQILPNHGINQCRLEKYSLFFRSKNILFFKLLNVEKLKIVSRSGTRDRLTLKTSIGDFDTSFDDGVIDKINTFVYKSEPKNLNLVINKNDMYKELKVFIFFEILVIIFFVIIVLFTDIKKS